MSVRNSFVWALVTRAGIVHAFAGNKSMCGLARRPTPNVLGKYDQTGAICIKCRRSVRDYEFFARKIRAGLPT